MKKQTNNIQEIIEEMDKVLIDTTELEMLESAYNDYMYYMSKLDEAQRIVQDMAESYYKERFIVRETSKGVVFGYIQYIETRDDYLFLRGTLNKEDWIFNSVKSFCVLQEEVSEYYEVMTTTEIIEKYKDRISDIEIRLRLLKEW